MERRADLSRLDAVIPVRSLGGGKSRLGTALDAEERETLTLGMLRNELSVLAAWGRVRTIHLVTPDAGVVPLLRSRGVLPILQAGDGLNEGIRQGISVARAADADAVLVLPADLPLLNVASLERLLDAADATLAAGSGTPLVVLVPADARGGTNALLLSPPDIIEPSFGTESLEQHLRRAASSGASVQLVVDPALGFDLDTPEDLRTLGSERLESLMALGVEGLDEQPAQGAARG